MSLLTKAFVYAVCYFCFLGGIDYFYYNVYYMYVYNVYNTQLFMCFDAESFVRSSNVHIQLLHSEIYSVTDLCV